MPATGGSTGSAALDEESTSTLTAIVDNFQSKEVVILGDAMVDYYIYTEARKLSREAPVIVSDYISESVSAGGAAHLATVAKGLGAKVSLIGVVGHDTQGESLLSRLESFGIDVSGVLSLTARPTCVKQRIYVGRRQYFRIDREERRPIDEPTANELSENLRDRATNASIVVLSDHDKGSLTPSLISSTLRICQALGKSVIGRPKVDHLFDFGGVNSLLSSVREASEATGISVINDTSVRNIGFNILSRLETPSVHLRDGSNSFLFEPNKVGYFPTPGAFSVSEKVGLRDLIAASYALACACSASPVEASLIAKAAEGIGGTSTANGRDTGYPEELKANLAKMSSERYAYKIVQAR